MNGFYKKIRLWIIGILGALFAGYILFVFGRLAFSLQPELVRRTPGVERGSIVDRNGKQLAVQTNFFHFGVTPKMIKDVQAFSEAVAHILEKDPDEISALITRSQNSSFIYLKKKLSQTTYEELSAIIDENGYGSFCRFDRIPGRIYPENDLASQLIGYMGDAGTGLSGIEYSQQSLLSPEPGSNSTETVYGKNIYLTIDANLQYRLEKISKAAMESTQAESLMLIAASASTGEILSYISLPSVNLNDYSTALPIQTLDRPAVSAYEPGSVFKIFSSATFLDAGSIAPGTSFLCDGVYQRTTSRGERIRITCLGHHGWVNVRDALKYSCNDALAQMSDTLDTDSFLSYIHRFGFGERTGVEASAETRGIVKDQDDRMWSGRTQATMAIGQEISVSALQMVQAATVIANHGVPVRLTFIQRITDKDGNPEYIHAPKYGDRVLKASTADYILSCMETTARSGTGTRANLGDISIGVKTGTAQMADPVNGGYSTTDFISNCMAIFPVEDPQIVLYIVIEKAKGETYAGRIVAPVIADAADEIIDHLGMNREGAASLEHSGRISINHNAPLSVGSVVPDFTGRAKRDLIPLLGIEGITFQINGEGWVVGQSPAPGTPVTENMSIELYLE